jgi:hypothetical protein
MEPKKHDKIMATAVNMRLFIKGLSIMLNAVINGSTVGDNGGWMGAE